MSPTSDGEVQYKVPQTPQETRSLLRESPPNAKIVAGGQSLMLLLRQGLLNPNFIIDISSVPEYSQISVNGDDITIGATTTYTKLREHPISSSYPMLEDAVSVIADPQVRNKGTIGGAVGHADPAHDILPPLLCLEATVSVGGSDGTRTIPLSEFHSGYMTNDLDPEELIEAIKIQNAKWDGSAYKKQSNVKGSWSTVGVSASISLRDNGERIDDVNVALAAVADTPIRSPTVEKKLTGSKPSKKLLNEAADVVKDDIDPVDDTSGSAQYKNRLAKAMTQRTLQSALERARSDSE